LIKAAQRLRASLALGPFTSPALAPAVLRIAAFEELLHRGVDSRAPNAIPPMVALLIDRLKLRIKPLDQLIKRRLLRLPRPIKAASFVFTAHCSRLLVGGRLISRRLHSQHNSTSD
jgi:hypothetical protein